MHSVLDEALNHALRQHRVGNLFKPSDICAHNIVARAVIFFRGSCSGLENVGHDALQTVVGVFEGPGVTGSVLLHLQRRGSNTTGVSRFTWAERDLISPEDLGRFVRGRHIGALRDVLHTVVDEALGMLAVELILGCARQRHVSFEVPNGAVGVVGRPGGFCDIVGNASATVFLDVDQELSINPIRGLHPTGGVGEANDSCTKRLRLLDRIGGNVAGAGDNHACTVNGFAVGTHHFVGEVHSAVARGFLAHEGATPCQPLTGEHARLVLVHQAAVLAKQEADFAPTHADVTRGDVAVFADVAPQFSHEGLAEAHDFGVGLALRVEVGPAFAAADGQTGERVFEDLFKAKEFDDAQVHARVESQTALVGAKCGVELDTEAAVDAHVVVIVDPRDAEDDLTLRLAEALDEAVVGVVRVFFQDDLQRVEHLGNCLVELGFSRVSLEHPVVKTRNFLVDCTHVTPPPISIGLQNCLPERCYNTSRPPAEFCGLPVKLARMSSSFDPAPSPKIVIAPDSFKSTATAQEAAEWLAEGVTSVIRDAQIILAPMADGGEGTSALFEGERICLPTTTADGRLTEAEYTFHAPSSTAYIDVSAASGLPAVEKPVPLTGDTYGTGVLIADAETRGAKRIVLGLGGTATVDGGTGILVALGVNPLDAAGYQLKPGGGALENLADFDTAKVNVPAGAMEWVLLTDTSAPATGPNGAAHVFGPQKGATTDDVELLDRGLARLCEVAEIDPTTPGLGAAGGVGIGLTWLSTMLHGTDSHVHIVPGARVVADSNGLTEQIDGAALVITGEGRFDGQTGTGKVASVVGELAAEAGAVFAIAAGRFDEQPADGTLAVTLPEIDDVREQLVRAGAEIAVAYLNTSTVQG